MTTRYPGRDRQRSALKDGSAILSLARRVLDSHPHFFSHGQTIQIGWVDDHLILSGQVPSFHLKQLAQEALRGLDAPIINQIDVVCCDGLSSPPHSASLNPSTPRNPR